MDRRRSLLTAGAATMSGRLAAYARQYSAQAYSRAVVIDALEPDVLNLIPEYNLPRRLALLADDLAQRGWTSTRIEKVLGQNFRNLFARAWG